MTKHRFVHLSDIHFGQERYGDKSIHEDVRIELLRDCSDMQSQIGSAQGLLVTGDIAYSGKPDQYKIAGEWLDQLSEKAGSASTDVSIIPGNHDIDINKIGTVGNIIQESLRTKPLIQLDAHLEEILRDSESSNPLLPKLAAYREFAERYGCGFLSPVQPIWKRNLQLAIPNKLNLVGMTSVMVSDLTDTVGNMVLGNQQYIVNRQDCNELVVMIHHPPHWFRDYVNAENYLNRAKVVLLGHEHNYKVRQIKHEYGETLWIHAGATNSPEGREPYQYRYNWIEFAVCVDNEKPSLEIKIYPRVWDSGYTKFVPDNNLVGKEFDFTVYHIPCSVFQIPIQEAVLESPTIPKPITTTATVGKVAESMNEDEESFIKLRYLFWKHLDWNERLKVLVKLDILPSDLTQPIPQTMERLALENARKAGKLKTLWDAVMECVPVDQRKPNPF